MRITEYGYLIESDQDSIVTDNVEALHEWIEANVEDNKASDALREFIEGTDPESEVWIVRYLDTLGIYIERYDLYWQEKVYQRLVNAQEGTA